MQFVCWPAVTSCVRFIQASQLYFYGRCLAGRMRSDQSPALTSAVAKLSALRGVSAAMPRETTKDASVLFPLQGHPSGGSSLFDLRPRVASSVSLQENRDFTELSRARRRRGATSLGPTPPPERPRGRLHPY